MLRQAFNLTASLAISTWERLRLLKWHHLTKIADSLKALFTSLTWIIPIALVIIIIFHSLSEDIITIEPIFVPKTFADGGYSPEVASLRLRDALNNFTKTVDSNIQNPSLSLAAIFRTSLFQRSTFPLTPLSRHFDGSFILVHNAAYLASL
jgi:hypothetical protein